MTAAVPLILWLGCGAPAQLGPSAVSIDDFESGVGAWSLNDGLAPKLGKATVPQIYPVTAGAPESKGKEAALVEFSEAQGTWASVSKAVSGEAWFGHGCSGIAIWLRGDGGRHTITLVLRSYLKVGDQVTDVSYKKEVALTTAGWFGLRAPFSSFKDDAGNAIDQSHLRAVKLFQLVKAGSWETVRFTVDDIRAEPLPPPQQPEASSEALLLDFDGLDRTSRLQPGICLGGGWAKPLQDEAFGARLKAALISLGRPLVKVKLSDFYLPGGIGLRSTDLDRVLALVRSAGCDPLLCLDKPPSTQGITPPNGWRDFGAFCASIAASRRAEPGARLYEIGSEPLEAGQFKTIEAATEAYNALAAQILLVDPEAEVGGMGFASPWDEHLSYFVEHARALRFLSFHFQGAHSAAASDEGLFEVACRGKAGDLPHQLTFPQVREMLDARPGPRVGMWITECALSSAREANGDARDPRIRTYYGAAWVTALSLAAAPHVDRIFWFKAFGNGWGLLNDDGTPAPAFQALTLLARGLPTGALMSTPTHYGKPLFVAPAATKDGRFVLIANGATSSVLDLQLSGTPKVEPARIRRVDPAVTEQLGFNPLAPSLTLRLTLAGPGSALIEAPLKR